MNYTEKFCTERFGQNHQWFKDGVVLETLMGSHAYGTNNQDSDYDVVAVVMDKHDFLFPQRYGYTVGYNNLPTMKNGVLESKGPNKKLVLDSGKEVEGEWRLLTNFCRLAVKGSPNLVEVLFAQRNLVTVGHEVGWMLRDNRKLFLSIAVFNSFKGYAFGQLDRLRKDVNRGKTENPKRQEFLDKFGYDVKMAYHTLRLLDQLEQLLTVGDLDLMKNKEECKAMRKGEWGTWKEFEKFTLEKLRYVEDLSRNGTLPPEPRTVAVGELLKNCVESYYGSESAMQKQATEYVSAAEVMKKLDRLERLVKQRSSSEQNRSRCGPF